MDCSLPGSSVHGIFQARILEWVAFSYSRGSSYAVIEPSSLAPLSLVSRFFTTALPRKPLPNKKLLSPPPCLSLPQLSNGFCDRKRAASFLCNVVFVLFSFS